MMLLGQVRQSTACRHAGTTLIVVGLLPACIALVVESPLLVPYAMAGVSIALIPGLALEFTGMIIGLSEPASEVGDAAFPPRCPSCDYDMRGSGDRCPECGDPHPSLETMS